MLNLDTMTNHFILASCCLLCLLLPSKAQLDASENYIKPPFDFIVVGAGAGGAVVASRLSEQRYYKVLLLEAGSEPEFLNDIPYFAPGPYAGQLDWNYLTVPQNLSCQAYPEKRCRWPSGKGLGGSTLINGMAYSRGNRLDYDEWQKLGNEGWSYSDVLPYFKKIETYEGQVDNENSNYHGFEGPITVSSSSYKSELASLYIQAGRELGYSTGDSEAARQKGFYNPLFFMRNGSRCSSYRGYLEPARKRPNLQIIIDALVTKVLFDGNKRAIGVEFERKGKLYNVSATKEVIISAGAKQSPQLLMLSGIGPRNLLERFEIPIVSELPGVGQNLEDHVAILNLQFALDKNIGLNVARDVNAGTLETWETNHDGVLTVAGTNELIAYVDSEYANKSIDYPDVEFYTFQKPLFPVLQEGYEFQPYLDPGKNAIIVSVILLRPKSSGFTEIVSNNPHDKPLFDPNYFSHPDDVKVLVSGFRLLQRMFNTSAFRQYGAKWNQENNKAKDCDKYPIDSDQYIECYIRSYSNTIFHPSGTCKMGPQSDKMAVVDSRLRVYGVQNLRIMDTSICPKIISGHTTMPTYMIGEKGSEMIKEDWRKVSG